MIKTTKTQTKLWVSYISTTISLDNDNTIVIGEFQYLLHVTDVRAHGEVAIAADQR